MKGKTFLIIVVVLAASYPIATGDYRLTGLQSRMQAFGEIAAERSVGIRKEIFEFVDESQTQVTKAARTNDKDDLRINQDNIHAETGLPHGAPLLPSPISDINGATATRHKPDLHAGSGVPVRFQLISSSEKNPPVMIDTETGASWFLSGEMDQRNWIWSPIQHEDNASVLSLVKP